MEKAGVEAQIATGQFVVSKLAGVRVRSKIESTVRYLGIDVDDALLIAEQVEI